MLITWVCRDCGIQLARVAASADNPRVAALTAQAGDDIIEIDREGNLVLHLLCEDCLETLDPEDESDIVYLQRPEIH